MIFGIRGCDFGEMHTRSNGILEQIAEHYDEKDDSYYSQNKRSGNGKFLLCFYIINITVDFVLAYNRLVTFYVR